MDGLREASKGGCVKMRTMVGPGDGVKKNLKNVRTSLIEVPKTFRRRVISFVMIFAMREIPSKKTHNFRAHLLATPVSSARAEAPLPLKLC